MTVSLPRRRSSSCGMLFKASLKCDCGKDLLERRIYSFVKNCKFLVRRYIPAIEKTFERIDSSLRFLSFVAITKRVY